ncbi:MAG: aldo/keto reductase [Verrucomicrobiota bacterium]
MNRRDFLQLLGATTVSTTLFQCSSESTDRWGRLLPQRVLGGTGESVTCLGLGGYHIGWTTEVLAQATIEAALEEGVRFFDTAESYGPHTSEIRYGKYLTPAYRNEIFLMTKSQAKTGEEARRHIEASLDRLKTDRIDLWQLHSIKDPADVEARLQSGVMETALQAQSEGLIRHIGFTGHSNPYAHTRMLELTRDPDGTSPFAACLLPINPVDVSARASFIQQVISPAQKSGVAILAMKTLADGRFFAAKHLKEKQIWQTDDPMVPDQISIETCIQFALSLPCSVLITGAEKPEYLREKAQCARGFQSLDVTERQRVIESVARFAQAAEVEYYKKAELRSRMG